MSKNQWKQVGGDMDWVKHGSTFARDDGHYVEVVHLDAWANMDSSAIPTHGLFNKQEGSVDHDDLGEGILPGALSDDIKQRLSYVGMDEEDYAKLEPIHKAAVYFESGGWDSDVSSNNLLELLPTAPENIEFWAGKETTAKVKEYNNDERRDAVRDQFESRMSAGEWPDDDVMEFAWGDEDFDMEMKGSDADAFEYAMGMAGIKKFEASHVVIKDLADFKKVVMALWNAPRGDELNEKTSKKAADVLNIDDDDELREEADSLAENAQGLASTMMESLGIEWI